MKQQSFGVHFLTPWLIFLLSIFVFLGYSRLLRAETTGFNPISLSGTWLFKEDSEDLGLSENWWLDEKGNSWREVLVPSAGELFAGESFDGIIWYKKEFTLPKNWKGRRIWLEFERVATIATIYLNGHEIGSHTGDYTRFRFEITDGVKLGEENVLTVRVDEAVGHVTQGFLSSISLHHGGIWGHVRVFSTGELAIKVDGIFADADYDNGRVRVSVAFDGEVEGGQFPYEVWITKVGSSRRLASAIDFADTQRGEFSNVLIMDSSPKLWEPMNPYLYELHVRLLNIKGKVSDEQSVKFGFRKVEAEGEYLKLNGKPITFRAVLDWGYYKEKVAPAPDEETIRRQFAEIKKLGFNGVKLVLVIMNPKYYEIADEMGVLLWQEYPLWHMPIDKTTRDELLRMYEAFYRQDRNHPSIILRSITCESGGVDKQVMGELYALGKKIIPNCLLEDNSSWFWLSNPEYAGYWDEHPYLTNPQWVRYIQNLDKVMAEKEPKPFLLGEAMAFNTWIDSIALLAEIGDSRPWWLPKCFGSALEIEKKIVAEYGTNAVETLLKDSYRYALLHRKFQIELFRIRPGNTGYVVNVIRDMPLIRCGLYDDLERLRWNQDDWSFQGDVSILPKTPEERNGFFLGEKIPINVSISNFGDGAVSAKNLVITSSIAEGNSTRIQKLEYTPLTTLEELVNPGEVKTVTSGLLSVDGATSPTPIDLQLQLKGTAKNSRRLWFLPRPNWNEYAEKDVYVHYPGYADIAKYIPSAPIWDETKSPLPENARVIFADVFTRKLLDFVNGGGKVIILASNWPGAFSAIEHSYWRDVPFIPRTAWTETEAQAILELQSYDLVQNYSMVVPTQELNIHEKVQPLLRLLDTHDLSEVIVYDQLFEARIGRGSLLVASLDFSTPAGQWLLSRLIDRLLTSTPQGKTMSYEEALSFSVPTPYALIPLLGNWKFQPDANNVGVAERWYLPDFDDSMWQELPVSRHWEGFGINYDGWAWYRRNVEIPVELAGKNIELIAEGIDDVYEVYVNGKFVKFHGDLKLGHPEGSVWLKRTVTKIGKFLKAGEVNSIVIHVLDWTGAGGIWKPIYLAVAQD